MDLTERYQDWIKAGEIAAQTLKFGKNLIKKEMSVLEICNKCDEKIIELGGVPAFPSQISCNDIAAHFCPTKESDFCLKDEVISLDVGACFKGAIGDNALSVDLSGKYSELIKASREALNNATKVLQIGTTLSEIGKEIQETINSFGFSPVRNLSGHGLDTYSIHTHPSIPNYNTHDNTELQKGMKIAIEPFATNGKGEIYQSANPTIFMLSHKKSVRSIFARQILKEIENYKGLPFTTRNLIEKFGSVKTNFALKELIQQGIISDYPPLIEVEHGMVSQAEHSFIIDDKIIKTTKSYED